MSSEAQLEAEKRWPLWLPTGDYETDRDEYDEMSASWQNDFSMECQHAFVSGAEWQSQRDEERIESLQARYYNATAGSKSLRPGEQDKIEKAIAVKRAEAAEALREAAHDLDVNFQSLPGWDAAYLDGVWTQDWERGADTIAGDVIRKLRDQATRSERGEQE